MHSRKTESTICTSYMAHFLYEQNAQKLQEIGKFKEFYRLWTCIFNLFYMFISVDMVLAN